MSYEGLSILKEINIVFSHQRTYCHIKNMRRSPNFLSKFLQIHIIFVIEHIENCFSYPPDVLLGVIFHKVSLSLEKYDPQYLIISRNDEFVPLNSAPCQSMTQNKS